jgi:hypothetical protein
MIEIKQWKTLSAAELRELRHFKSTEVAGSIIVNNPDDEAIIMRHGKNNTIVAFCLISKTHPDVQDTRAVYVYNTYGNRLILCIAFELYESCRLHELRTDIDAIKLWLDQGGKISGIYKKPTVDMRCIDYVTIVFTTKKD